MMASSSCVAVRMVVGEMVGDSFIWLELVHIL